MADWEKWRNLMSDEERIRLLDLPCEERYKIMNSWEQDKRIDYLFWMKKYLREHPDIAKRERDKQIDYKVGVEAELYRKT